MDVTLEGAGVRVMLYGGQNGQSVQVRSFPRETGRFLQDKMWFSVRVRTANRTNSTGFDGGEQRRLTLVSTEVVLSQGHTVTLQGTGQLIGEEATMVADAVQASGQSVLTGTETASLTLGVERPVGVPECTVGSTFEHRWSLDRSAWL